MMLAVMATHADARNPLGGLKVGDWSPPPVPPGWTTVSVRAAALNHHDVWTLRGVGVPAERLPLILGVDGAGVDEAGNEVIVYPVVGDRAAGHGDETLDPAMGLLGGEHHGTFAERVAVPRDNLVPKPADMSFEESACLPGAWLTAYRMLFDKAAAEPGATILVQGAGGGVATALVRLGAAAGFRMWVTSRRPEGARLARELGAEAVFGVGERLPSRVDVVMDTVGSATWDHSLKVVRPGGRVVTCGATSGGAVTVDLARVFYRQISIVGATLGTSEQLRRLVRFCAAAGVRPAISDALPLTRARDGFAAMIDGRVAGKIVFTA